MKQLSPKKAVELYLRYNPEKKHRKYSEEIVASIIEENGITDMIDIVHYAASLSRAVRDIIDPDIKSLELEQKWREKHGYSKIRIPDKAQVNPQGQLL